MSSGYYEIYMLMGNPPQKQRFILDTGSHILAVRCGRCLDCAQGEYKNYEFKNSTTNVAIKCVQNHKHRVTEQ